MKRKTLLKLAITLISTFAISNLPINSYGENLQNGKYKSELTNEWIDESLRDQRPIAVLLDNELTALEHYGINYADIVYENLNSTDNNRITRLTAIIKDWENIEQLGSIRSARPTNFVISAEYNAILCHDGGPFYIDEYVARKYTNNLSGGFARFSNGKAIEFTEYITSEDYHNPKTGKNFSGLKKRFANSGYSREYNDYYKGPHFKFSDHEYSLEDQDNAVSASEVILPFPHNSSMLKWNDQTGTYDYYEYGKIHIDALDQSVTTFENVIIYDCDMHVLDNHGYMTYDLCSSSVHDGYYITNENAIPISWKKEEESAPTHFYNVLNGEEILLNTGKTYIGIVPSDSWKKLIIK